MKDGKSKKVKTALKKANKVGGKIVRGTFKSFLLLCIILED